MASTTTLLPRRAQYRLFNRHIRRLDPSRCSACATASSPKYPSQHRNRRAQNPCQYISTAAQSPRAELENTLLELQKQCPDLIDLSRLQLALQGLRQESGSETVRIAVLGVANGSKAGPTAWRVLRALLADPLRDGEPWEKELESCNREKPLIVRVGPPQKHAVSLKVERQTGLDEIYISSPQMDGFNLEFLLIKANLPHGSTGEMSIKALEDAVMIPKVDIPTAADQTSLISAPVHKALLVADGLAGAVNISRLPIAETDDSIAAAVQFEGVSKSQLGEATFNVVDVSLAEQAVRLFRQGAQHGMDYKRLWFSSNIPALDRWLKASASSSSGETKPAVRKLIARMLQNTLYEAQLLEARGTSKTLTPKSNDPNVATLNEHLAYWAQNAHSELQEELDLGFSGRRWRKLGWWQLFWRVDDVAMLTNEMLSQRFMPTAEQELVYLTGRIAELGGAPPEYPQPKPSSDPSLDSESRTLGFGVRARGTAATSSSSLPKWPGHIAFARRYLQNETVPALQSLAQKLVVRSLSTSGLATSLAVLLYVSSLASTLYEAGAVAALGIVYSLGRLQKKWDAARTFWEGEVREEGRKAVRAAEESVATILESDKSNENVKAVLELEKTKDLVAKAEDALARMK